MLRPRLARSASLALAAAAALAAGGCSLFMRSIEKPQVAVRGVAVQAAGFTGLDGQVRLDVTNPNPVGVPLSGIDWQLAVGGAAAVTGHVDVSQTIPAHGVAPVTAQVHLDAAAAVEAAERLASGARTYALDARLHFSTAVGDVAVDVHADGALSDAL